MTRECHDILTDPSDIVDWPFPSGARLRNISTAPQTDDHAPRRDDVEFSVIIPVFNEEKCLPSLYDRVTQVMEATGRTYEIVFVDDGSDDGSLNLIRAFSARDANTRHLSFTRNFGQAAAITAGQMVARGLGLITIDADLQNPPEEIPKLLEAFDAGYEVVYGIRRNRRDPWLRRAGSHFMVRLLQATMHTSLQPNVTAFMIAHRRIIAQLNRFPERTRFHPALCAWLGAKTTHVDVNHEARLSGKSKYNYLQLATRALDIITSSTLVPLRIAMCVGIAFGLLGFGMAGFALIRKLMSGDTLLGWPSLMAMIGLLGGAQLVTIGILGEYLGRMYMQCLGRPLFVLREQHGPSDAQGTR